MTDIFIVNEIWTQDKIYIFVITWVHFKADLC
jgi:hypothetical protein